MKKLFLVGALALFGAMNAQTEKGSWVAGGSTTLGFNNANSKVKSNGNSVDGPKISTFTVTPSVGYFVINKLAIGIDLGFNSLTSKQDQSEMGISYHSKSTVSTFSVMPTATYYFKSDSKLLPYLGAGLGFASSKTKSEISGGYSNSSEFKNDGFAWKAKGGLIYLITPSIGIDLGVSFNQVSSSEDYPNYIFNGFGVVQSGTYEVKTVENTFGVNAGFSFFFK